MTFSMLWTLNVPLLLRKACSAIEECGYSNTMSIDPYTGEVNAIGALALACGATSTKMKHWDGEDATIPVRCGMLGTFLEIVTFVEAAVDSDLDDWCQTHNKDELITIFRQCADRIEMSVT